MKEKYYKLVQENFATSSRCTLGINSECYMSELDGFSISKNLMPDPFHDIVEGVISFDFPLILLDLFPNKESQTNFEKKVQDTVGWKNNKININWQQKKLVGSGASLKELFERLPEFYIQGFEDMESWKIYLKLREIVSTIHSSKYTSNDIDNLKVNIDRYFRLMNNFAGEEYRIKPKTHLLHHYPLFLQNFGPLFKFDTLHNERFNLLMKDLIATSKCHKNIPWSVADRIQEMRAVTLTDEKRKLKMTKIENLQFNEYQIFDFSSLSKEWKEGELFTCNSLIKGYTMYRKNDTLKMKTSNENPIFIQILKIVSNGSDFMLMCRKYEKVKYTRNLHSYKMDLGSEIVAITTDDLYDQENVMVFNIEYEGKRTFFAHKTCVHVMSDE